MWNQRNRLGRSRDRWKDIEITHSQKISSQNLTNPKFSKLSSTKGDLYKGEPTNNFDPKGSRSWKWSKISNKESWSRSNSKSTSFGRRITNYNSLYSSNSRGLNSRIRSCSWKNQIERFKILSNSLSKKSSLRHSPKFPLIEGIFQFPKEFLSNQTGISSNRLDLLDPIHKG